MRTWLPIICGVALAACGRASPTPPPPPPPTPSPPTAGLPAAHAATMAQLDRLAASSDPVAAESMRSIGGRLQYEASHRPATPLRAEAVLAALARAGVSLAEQKQYVAMTVQAAYCVGGQTADGLSVAVCEYPSPAAAAAGRAYVTARFQIPELARVIHVRGATTLALGHPTSTPLAATTRRAAAAFQTM